MRKALSALLIAALVAFSPASAQSPGFPQVMPPGTVYGRTAISAGPGQAIPFADLFLGSLPIFTTTVSTRPTPVEVWPGGAFAGDNSKINLGINYTITGDATLGQPTTGYVFTPEATPIVGNLVINSGHNQQTGGNDGRTMGAWLDSYLSHNGQGDGVNFFCNDELNQHLVGATSWLANPAITCIVGQFAPSAGGAGGFINPENWIVVDNGFDITSIMSAANGTRTNNTGALGTLWYGTFYQSLGTKAWDAYFKGQGPTVMGVDFTSATCSLACFASPGFSVDGSGNTIVGALLTGAFLSPHLLISENAPTIGSCGGGSPAISANNGTGAFRVTVGSATSTCAIGLPTATTGWNCYATDLTTTSTTVFVTKQTASSVSGATLGNFNDVASAANWSTSDVLAVSCFAL